MHDPSTYQTRYDAGTGVVLLGSGDGVFASVPSADAGIFLNGEVRSMGMLSIKEQKVVVIASNNEELGFYKIIK